MTTSTFVERRRLRARLALLSFSTILCSGLAAPVLAQTQPTFRNVDANGVDLTQGDFLLSFEDGSIGSGQAKLSLMRQSGYTAASQWDNISFRRTRSGSSFVIALVLPGRIGATFTPVSGSSTAYTSNRADGSSLTLNTTGSGNYEYTYVDADGSSIMFTDPTEYDDTNTNNFCHNPLQSTCDMIPTRFSNPRGQTVDLTYDLYPYGSMPDLSYGWRIASVANQFGYSIAFHYLDDTPNPDDFYVRTGAQFLNGTTVAGAVSYTTPAYAVTDVTDMAGNVWEVTGSSIRRPGESTPSFSLSGGVVTRDGVATSYARSVSGSTATMTVTDALAHATTIVSDLTIGRPTSVTDALSHVTTYSYDGYGRLTRTTQPEGNYVNYTFDARGNVTETRVVAKAGSGLADIVSTASYPATCSNPVTCNQPTDTTDARGNTTVYGYDATTGAVTSVTAPAAATGATQPQVRYSYAGTMLTGVSTCATGTAPSCVGTSDEVKTTIGHDANANVTSVAKGAGDGSLTATTTATYTALGDVASVDGPLAGTADTVTFRYDAARRQTGVISPDPDGTGSLKQPARKVSYDSAGRATVSETGTVNGTSDADWAAFVSLQQASATYDANGYKTKDATTAGTGTYQVRQYSYDADGRLECTALRMNPAVWGSLPGSACTLGTSATFGPDRIGKTSYDAVGRTSRAQSAYGTADQSDDATATYNANGTLATLADANGNVTGYTYDGVDRLAETHFPAAGTGVPSPSDYAAWAYDAGGNVTSRRTRAGYLIGYSYDALGRVSVKDIAGGTSTDVYYGYDLLGRLLYADFAGTSGPGIANAYDALGRVSTTTSTMGGVSRALSYQYDAAGDRTRITHPDGVSFAYGYDGLNRMNHADWYTPTIGPVPFFGIAYDDLGNRSATYRASSSTTYGYDAASRLTGLSQNFASGSLNGTAALSYTPANQIASRTQGNDAYAWTGAANRDDASGVNALNQATSVGSATLTYDADGNLASDGSTSYGYDVEDRLVSATGAHTLSLAYDPLGRLWQTSGGGLGVSQFLYDGDHAVVEYDGDTGGIRGRYAFGPGADEPILWDTNSAMNCSETRFLHHDERGSIVAVADCFGNPVQANSYDEYGVPAAGNWSTSFRQRYQYTGQMWLPELGMYYYKARMYAPHLGRFMQTDPIGYGGGMNWYGYVGGDPVNGIDPSGLARFAINECYPLLNQRYKADGTKDGPPTMVGLTDCSIVGYLNFGTDDGAVNQSAPVASGGTPGSDSTPQSVTVDKSCKNSRAANDPRVQAAALSALGKAESSGAEQGIFAFQRNLRPGGFAVSDVFSSGDARGITRDVTNSNLPSSWSQAWNGYSSTPTLFIHTHQNNPPPSPIGTHDAESAAARGFQYAAIDRAGNLTCSE